jgi:3-methyladenine DNA glycosylase AlkD
MADLGPHSTAAQLLAHLHSIASEENRQGMNRYGIKIDNALGISHGVQRKIAKLIKRDHDRAFELWDTGIMEARFIASVTADPKLFTAQNARDWAAAFDSWDIVDGVSDLFVGCADWRPLILEFAADEREFVRRTAFAMMAWASVHRKGEPDATFLGLFPVIERYASDNRNFVWKAVSWALRSIGKRSMELNEAAISLSRNLTESTSQSARRIGRESLKELSAEKTRAAIIRRAENREKRGRQALPAQELDAALSFSKTM